MYLQTTQTMTLNATFILESVLISHYSLSDEFNEYDEEEQDAEPYCGDPDDGDDLWDDSIDD